MYSDTELDVIAADGIKELNYKQKKLFLASLSRANADREKYKAELIKIIGDGVYNKLRDKFLSPDFREELIAGYEKRRVECVTVKSADYPYLLKNTPVPPLVLYVRGNRSLIDTRMLGVVGSRRTTAQVIEQCKNICAQLSAHVTVVTGVADGADTAAAKGGLETGNVACVLPYGHDADSTPTLREVEKNGLSISEFPPMTKAQRYTFTLRNRVLAGLCDGVLVISAGEKSGALSTANYAADYSRDVFAFPYGIGVSSGVGCNTLIKNGAYLADCAGDVLRTLDIEEDVSEQPELDGDERAIVNLLKSEGEMHAQKIATRLNKKLTEIITVCSMLEIKRLIIRTGGNTFSAL